MRIEPPASLPCAIGTTPAATAAAEPPLDPPGVRDVSQGLRVGPNRLGSVVTPIANSGVFVLPNTIRPAALYLATNSESRSGMNSPRNSLPSVNRTPAYSARNSLSRKGTPVNGPVGIGAEAAFRAISYIGVTTALMVGFTRSRRSMAMLTRSTGCTSPCATNSACPVASRAAISLNLLMSRNTPEGWMDGSGMVFRQTLYVNRAKGVDTNLCSVLVLF